MRRPLGRFASAASVFALAAAPASAATTSSNWAGYAVHRAGVRFRSVSASWTVPAVTCSSPSASYSAAWVGIGGYHTNAAALEQVGTEADCSAAGGAHYSAWYELVPSTSVRVRMTVRPSDVVAARVSVAGKRVTVDLRDVTRGTRFTKSLSASAVDTTSAEWIVEAPSECVSASRCRVLPLAAFATTTFGAARAVSTAGSAGSISNPAWAATAIDLAANARPFGRPGNATTAATVTASTGALSASGDSFTVAFGPSER